MPRVIVKTKNRAGADRACGKCAAPILPGDKYRSWAFRFGGTYYRCSRPECAPRPSDLTQSLMGDVYAAIENAQDSMATTECVTDVKALVEEVTSAVEEVASAYREAAEAFGGAGENAERADELEGWQGDLESFDPSEEDDEFDEESIGRDLAQEMFGVDDVSAADGEGDPADRLEAWLTRMQEARDEHADAASEALEGARDEAFVLLNGCPL